MDQTPEKGFSIGWVILIIVLVAAVVGGGLYVLGKAQGQREALEKQTPATTPKTTTQKPTTPSPTSSADETANWKTYTNEKYGYSIRYPSAYSTKEWADTIKTGAAAEPNKELLSVIGFGNNSRLGDYEVSVTVTNDTLQRRRTLACYEFVSDRNESETTIDGVKAYKITCKSAIAPNDMVPDAQKKVGEKIINIVFQKGDYVYVLLYNQTDLSKDTSNIFAQMFSTFKFTK